MSKSQLVIIQLCKLQLERLYYPSVAVAFVRDWNPKIYLSFPQFKMEFRWAEMYFKDSLITAKKKKKKSTQNLFRKFSHILQLWNFF